MPYIGNQAGNRFVASKAATQHSGDGSTTVFPLDHAVSSDEDILVSVDGVIQEPSVAYAVSNGAVLTFTAAPSSNSGNNIFVYYLFRTVATVDHPATSALSATSGTFSTDLTVDTDTLKVDSTNDQVGINTATPSNYYSTSLVVTVPDEDGITIVGGETHRNYIMFADGTSSTAQYRGFIDYDHNTDTLNLGSGGGTRVELDGTGAMRNTFQPAFMAKPASAQSGIANGTTLVFGTEIFDQNADFASNTFTAPVTGRYQISYTLYFENVLSDITAFYVTTVLSNRNIYTILDPQAYDQTVTNLALNFSLLVDMDANDTAKLIYYKDGGGDTTNFNTNSYFSGHLVC